MSNSSRDFVHRSINIFAEKPTYQWFFADAPHLMKTTRNCIYHSGEGNFSRLMWNGGSEIIWKHFSKIVENQHALKECVKLTESHINLNPYSLMNVKLATQVLSETVGKYLLHYYPEASATSKLCLYMDSFFDIFNVRCESESIHKLKPNLMPFRSTDDHRFNWLENEFLPYF